MKTGIYIAGPMTGLPDFNFPAFHEAEARLSKAGWFDIGNPAKMDEDNGFDATGMTGNEKPQDVGFDLAETLKMDLAWIADKATAIALLPGWENSKGVAAEVALGKALGLEIRAVEDFIFNVGDRVWVVKDAERSAGYDERDREASVHDCYATIDGPLDGELELFVEGEDGWHCGYVRFQDVLPAKPAVSVAELHEALVKDAERTLDTFDTIESLSGEVRITSETGGQKGKKLAELGTVDPLALLTLAEVSGFGAQKYDAFNYLKGYGWDLSFNAMTRHMLSFWNGEDLDDESGLPHITHAAWHALALTSFFKRGLGTDNRFKREAA